MMLSTNEENFDKEGEGEKREESLEGLGEPSHKEKVVKYVRWTQLGRRKKM